MKGRSFSLRPFSAVALPAGLGIAGYAERNEGIFFIRYEVRGPSSQVMIPPPAEIAERRNRLWEGTCFEFFLAPKNSDRYWEFNLSPSGHWNVYRFASYRQGMKEEGASLALPFLVEVLPESLVISLKVDTSAFVGRDQVLDAGIAAIIMLADGTLSYWALSHPSKKPDFHRRDSFLIEV